MIQFVNQFWSSSSVDMALEYNIGVLYMFFSQRVLLPPHAAIILCYIKVLCGNQYILVSIVVLYWQLRFSSPIG